MKTEFLIWDDTGVISENPAVSGGLSWENLRKAFTEEVLNLWTPLTSLSHQLDVSLFGLNSDFHHVSALFHHLLAATALLWLLAKCLQADPKVALLVTVLFVLHPLQVESWAWLSQRKDTLSALFAFLSLGFWMRYLRSGSKTLVIGCLLTLALGLLSKPVVVIVPALFCVAAIIFSTGRLSERSVLIPLTISIVMAGAVTILTLYLQGLRPEATLMGTINPLSRACLGFANYWRYFSRLILPVDLHYFTPYPDQLPVLQAVLGILLLSALFFLALRNRRKDPMITFGVALFVFPLVPTVGFITSGEAFGPDRYAYIAATGMFLLAAQTFTRLELPRLLALSLLLSLCLVISIASYKQALTWRTMDTLTSHSLAILPDNYKAHAHRAEWHAREGEMGDALHHWRLTFAARPDHDVAAIELGRAALQETDHEAALHLFRTHQRYWPDSAASLEGVGVSLAGLGRLGEAEEAFEELLRKDPGNPRHQRTLERLRGLR